MANKFEQALAVLDPSKRAFLKRIVASAAFAVPAISSFAVGDLASAGPACTTTIFTTITTVGTVTRIETVTIPNITTTTATVTKIVTVSQPG